MSYSQQSAYNATSHDIQGLSAFCYARKKYGRAFDVLHPHIDLIPDSLHSCHQRLLVIYYNYCIMIITVAVLLPLTQCHVHSALTYWHKLILHGKFQ